MPANRPPQTVDRRRVLAALTATSVGLAGCQTLDDDGTSDATDPGTRTLTTQTRSSTTSETRAKTSETDGASSETDASTTEADPTTTERPRAPACADCSLLSTNYGGDDGRGHALEPVDDELDAAVAVLTDAWRTTVDERELTSEARRFLADTDFSREHVVAVQFREHSCCQRLSLARFDRDGDRVRLRLDAPAFGPLQAENDKLVLVRAPTEDRGVPDSAVARIVIGDEFDVTITPDDVER
ncbi:hypothetical protein G9C85_02365 [Halorubellus sp. JP-L1]|uniref:hypothetical protein n=1 Tax=Halorubellus sp. JP-L1 TaxID=2715753 RepID=UPI001409C37F|nr:hypothetical protein [Halorubellus sp. JP-L1]NHN40481.1 hypothetical protein [Halorubellus sp. JP-L1]